MENDGILLTDEQRDTVYKDLEHQKLEITRIQLYDAKEGQRLFEMYEEIIRHEKQMDLVEITKRLATLELEIANYQKNKSHENKFKVLSNVLLQQLEDLQVSCEELEPDEFEQRLLTIECLYNNNLKSYSFEERDILKKAIYSLKVELMIKKAKTGDTSLLKGMSDEEKMALEIATNEKILELAQSSGPNVQSMVDLLKSSLLDNDNLQANVMENVQFWKLLDMVKSGRVSANNSHQLALISSSKTQFASNTEMIPAKDRVGIFQRIKQMFARIFKPKTIDAQFTELPDYSKIPVELDDIENMNIEWLAENIPQSMLEQMENKRLKLEGNDAKIKYLPDKKAPIFNFFKEYHQGSVENYIESNAKDKKIPVHKKCYTYDSYKKFTIKFYQDSWYHFRDSKRDIYGNHIDFEFEEDSDKITKSVRYSQEDTIGKGIISVLDYANMIDELFGTNWKAHLIEDLKYYYDKDYKEFDWGGNHGNISSNWRKFKDSYEKLRNYCNEHKREFEDVEKQRRTDFYRRNSLKNSVKRESTLPEPISQNTIDNGNSEQVQLHEDMNTK